MAHPTIDNQTPFAFAPMWATNGVGHTVVGGIVKATYHIAPEGGLTLAETQRPVSAAGEPWEDDPAVSGYKFEPEVAYTKRATDVAVVGLAQPPGGGPREFDVAVKVGGLGKVIRVVGPRKWTRSAGNIIASTALPARPVPLSYQFSFGGWDTTHPDPKNHGYESRNPIGCGFRAPKSVYAEDLLLPLIEDPLARLTEFGGYSNPVNLGFTNSDWQPRRSLGGTYDAAWTESRKPLLPVDFSEDYFNGASEGLVAPGYLAGDEEVFIRNVAGLASQQGFRLPGIVPPTIKLVQRPHRDHLISTKLDTVIVDGFAGQLLLLWRANMPMYSGLHALTDIVVTCENAPRHPAPPLPDNVIPIQIPGQEN